MFKNIMTIVNLAILAMNIAAVYYLLTRKRHVAIDAISWLVTLAAAFAFAMFARAFVDMRSIVTVLSGCLFLVPALLLFKEHWKVKIFAFFMVFTLSQYIVLIFTIFYYYSELVFRQSLAPLTIYLISVGSQICVFIMIYRYFLKLLRPVLKFIEAGSAIFSLLPIGACVLLAIIKRKGSFDIYSLIIVLMVTGMLLAVIYLLSVAISLTAQQNQLKKQLSFQLDHYKNLTDSVQQNYDNQQDIQKYLLEIAELVSNQEAASLQEYLASLNEQYAKTYVPTFCNNRYVDAVIAHYFKIAQQAAIQLSIKVALPEKTGVESLDLCVIIGNCLENAIEACRAVLDSDERKLSINAKIAHGYLAITVKNSCADLIKIKQGQFVSSKQANRLGVGLASVRLLTNKYDGELQVFSEKTTFVIAIALKIP